MQNITLAKDYITRASKRLLAIEALYKAEAWADTVRESQEAVELALKALLRSSSIEVPRIHDVSGILEKEIELLPAVLREEIPLIAAISKSLRRDRELAFYGSEDLTPSEFYSAKDAQEAFEKAKKVVTLLLPHVK